MEPQYIDLLRLIAEEGEVYPGFFSDELDVPSYRIDEMLKKLCKEGYITCRTYTTPGGKVKYIEPIITTKGSERIREKLI